MGQRRKTDQALRENLSSSGEGELERYRDFIITIGDACFEFDLHGRATFCNETAHRLLGYTREEYMNLSHSRRYSTKDKADTVFHIFNELYRLNLPVRVFEVDFLCRDGSEITLEMSVSLIRNKNGVVTGFRGIGRDITGRKKVQAELERYREFIENIGDGCFEIDLKGKLTCVNEVIEKRMGYAHGELIGAGRKTYAVPGEMQRLFDVFMKIYQTGEPATLEDLLIRDKNGTTRYISATVSLMRNSIGSPVGFRGTTRDVTDKIRARAALLQSEEKYRTILENIFEAYIEADLGGNIKFVNDAACLMTGYPREELTALNYRKLVSDETRRTMFAVFSQIYNTGKPETLLNFEVVRRGGGRVLVELNTMLLRNGEGRPAGYRVMARDVTARRNVEENLRRSEEKYRSIMESIMEGYLEYDMEGNFIYANDAACTMMGYPREELLAMNYRQIVTARMKEIIEQATRDMVVTNAPRKLIDFEVIRKDGSRRIHQHNLSLIRNVQGRPEGVRAMGRDVTELKWAEEALRQSEERIRLLFRNIPVPTFVWKAQHDKNILSEFNSAAFQFIGDGIIDSLGKPAEQFFVNMPQIAADIARCMDLKKNVENQFWYNFDERSEKRYVIVKYAFAPPDSVLMHVNDITGQKRVEENLQFISIHDALTGLFNRFYSDAEINRLAASRMRPVSIIVIDLNNLKRINDECGHAMGDLYIKNAANILKQSFRPEDMIARVGGDEFLVLLPMMDENICAQAIQRLSENIRLFNLGSEFPISLSAGFATAHTGDNLLERIREADRRMYEDKAAYKSSFAHPLHH